MSETFVRALDELLGERLSSFYVYGAATFPHPPTWHLDFDYHALISERPNPTEITKIRALQDDDFDGYFVLLDDAIRSMNPRCPVSGAVDEAWALHRAHIHAGRVQVLHGDDPSSIVPVPTWDEVEADLDGELDYVRNSDANAYCILNLCRLLYSWTTRDVVTSKYASAHWALPRLPAWRDAIQGALRRYQQESRPGDAELLAASRDPFLAFCEAEIGRLRA